MKTAIIATALAMAVAPLQAIACTGWRAVYAADIGRLNAFGRILAEGRTKAHDDLFSKALKEMGDDKAAAEADKCVWGAK